VLEFFVLFVPPWGRDAELVFGCLGGKGGLFYIIPREYNFLRVTLFNNGQKALPRGMEKKGGRDDCVKGNKKAVFVLPPHFCSLIAQRWLPFDKSWMLMVKSSVT
jgi:hypothetical protein